MIVPEALYAGMITEIRGGKHMYIKVLVALGADDGVAEAA